MAELLWDEESREGFFLMRWEIFHMLLAGGNNLVQKERMMQKREGISLASEKLRRNRTQYTSWGGVGVGVGKSNATAGRAEDVGPDVGNSVDLVEFNFADKKKNSNK